MLIILEGPNGAGKSTVADAVRSSILHHYPGSNVEILHCGPPKSHPLNEYEEPLLSYRPGEGHHIICDRWHLGELVYPRVLGRQSLMDHATLTHVELLLQSRGALLAYVGAPGDVLVQRILERGDNLIQSWQVAEIQDLYSIALLRTRLPIWRRYGAELRDFAEHIVTRGAHFATQAQRLNGFRTYVGPPEPSALVLGDVRHRLDELSDPGANLWPAFVPRSSTSGRYLLDALTHQHQRNLGLANACDVDDPGELWLALNRPPTVAVGRNAARRLRESGVMCGSVPHPQYWRRFLHGYQNEYGALIAEALDTGRDLGDQRPDRSWVATQREAK